MRNEAVFLSLRSEPYFGLLELKVTDGLVQQVKKELSRDFASLSHEVPKVAKINEHFN
jgi:hypothetical protein